MPHFIIFKICKQALILILHLHSKLTELNRKVTWIQSEETGGRLEFEFPMILRNILYLGFRRGTSVSIVNNAKS